MRSTSNIGQVLTRVSRNVFESRGQRTTYILDDYTNWRHFGKRFGVNVLVCLDHILWAVVNFFLLAGLSALALVLGAWDCVRWVAKVTTHPRELVYMSANATRWVRDLVITSPKPFFDRVIGPRFRACWRIREAALVSVPAKAPRLPDLHAVLKNWRHKWPPPPHAAPPHRHLSAVNSETPNIHTAYCSTPGSSDFTDIDLKKEEFDLDNAIFFLRLSALVYENEDTLSDILGQWHLQYEAVLRGEDDYTGCAAWVIYHSSKQCQAKGCKRHGQDFLAVVFKGTSPFDCVDWMTDSTMLKIKPYGESLPGMIHEGFFKEFEWPRYLKPITGEHPPLPTPHHVTDGYVCNQRDIASRLARDGDQRPDDEFHPPLSFYERLIRTINGVIAASFPKNNAALWITGHSMGGALASILFAHLLHVPAPHPLGDHRSWLKGGYAFGAPRTGDARYAAEVGRYPKAAHFYDITNANDGVHSVPLALGGFRDDRALTNFSHIGKPILLNYWCTYTRVDACRWPSFVKNFSHIGSFFCHWVSAPFYWWRTEISRWAVVPRWFLFFVWFMYDHMPSEYLRHLEGCKHGQATATATTPQ